ncbi:MAG: sugar phosphate isomerase/epimerase [candidate division Zixibacteria bacterium]|nr:sugar phosphate isomerase/epimerase [candidate division Zixibacteria bacterium]
MYASIRDGTLLGGGYKNLLEGLRDVGLSAVELEVFRDSTVRTLTLAGAGFSLTGDKPLNALKTHYDEHGIRISALMLGNNFNAENVDAEIAWCVTAINAAGFLGVKAVRIDSIMRGEREMRLDARIETFTKGITLVLEATEGSSVQLGIENHGVSGNQREFLDGVLDRVDHPRLGTTMDTGNFYWYGYPLDTVYDILAHFAPKAKHTHVKNIAYPEPERGKQREIGWKYGEYAAPLPDGDIDLWRVAGFLKSVGYTGDMCVEDESIGRMPEAERREALRRDAAFVREICG